METIPITGQTRLDDMMTSSFFKAQTGTASLYFTQHFVWIDFQAESCDELIDYLKDPEFFSDNPTLYEAIALIFHSIQQLGGSLKFLGRELGAISLADCSGGIPLQDDTIVYYNGGFFTLGHLLKEYADKGANPDLFKPDVTKEQADTYTAEGFR